MIHIYVSILTLQTLLHSASLVRLFPHIDNTNLTQLHTHISNAPPSSTHMFNPFSRAPRGGAAWFNAGPASSFPDIEADPGPVGQQRKCADVFAPGCKVFHVPKEDASQARPVAIDDWKDGEADTKDQVMIFKYAGKIVAVNHVRASRARVSPQCLPELPPWCRSADSICRNVRIARIRCRTGRRSTLRISASGSVRASRARSMIGALI